MKCLIVILGAGASGKSTLTRTMCGEGGKEDMLVYNIKGKGEKAKYAVFPNGSAIAGNIKNGSDSISNMEARASLIQDLLKMTNVQFVITDGVRSSKKWDVDWVQENLNCAVLYVYMDISLDANLARLVKRRESNGKTAMDPKTYENMLAFRERAASVWQAANTFYKKQPVKFFRVYEEWTPAETSRQVKLMLLQMFEEESQKVERNQLLRMTGASSAVRV